MSRTPQIRARYVELVGAAVERATRRVEADDDADRDWLLDRVPPRLRTAAADLSVTALHLLDRVVALEEARIIDLARETDTPKGTVSKAARALTDAGLVERHQRPDNRKEVRLRATPDGRELQRAHAALHAEMSVGLAEMLDRYSDTEVEIVLAVLADVATMPRDGLRWRPDLLPPRTPLA